ncbi:MAG: helix-turn-helix domain-containing protein [Clostridia bacterium]|nr:helix-turn-helix domain-containing protein [Clostridia bacterium]
MNTLDINHISPRVFNYFPWLNTKKNKATYNKFAQTYRFICVINGSCKVTVDSTCFDCNAGSIVFLPPGVKYSSEHLTDEIYIFNIFFDMTRQNADFDTQALIQPYLFTQYKIIDKYVFTDHPVFNSPQHIVSEAAFHICRKILREIEQMNPLCDEFINVYIHQMLLCIARESNPQAGCDHSNVAQKIIDYIHKNVNANIDAASIARTFSYHPNYISRIMKKATGVSLHRFILDTKLEAAENLICGTDYSITDIAFALSFNNSSHFSQKFRQKYGISPTEYRRKYS